jgi:hypothetical protein
MPLRRGGAISGLPYQLLKGSRGIKQAFLRISLWALPRRRVYLLHSPPFSMPLSLPHHEALWDRPLWPELFHYKMS